MRGLGVWMLFKGGFGGWGEGSDLVEVLQDKYQCLFYVSMKGFKTACSFSQRKEPVKDNKPTYQ